MKCLISRVGMGILSTLVGIMLFLPGVSAYWLQANPPGNPPPNVGSDCSASGNMKADSEGWLSGGSGVTPFTGGPLNNPEIIYAGYYHIPIYGPYIWYGMNGHYVWQTQYELSVINEEGSAYYALCVELIPTLYFCRNNNWQVMSSDFIGVYALQGEVDSHNGVCKLWDPNHHASNLQNGDLYCYRNSVYLYYQTSENGPWVEMGWPDEEYQYFQISLGTPP